MGRGEATPMVEHFVNDTLREHRANFPGNTSNRANNYNSVEVEVLFDEDWNGLVCVAGFEKKARDTRGRQAPTLFSFNTSTLKENKPRQTL